MTKQEEGKVLSLQEKLLEEIAELEHEQWSHIIWYLNKEHMLSLGKWMSAYYLTLIKKPYSELSEAKKESDREWARKVLKIVDKYSVSKQEIRKLTEGIKYTNSVLLDDLKVVIDEIDREVYSKPQEVFDRLFELIKMNMLDNEKRLLGALQIRKETNK